MTVEVRGNPKTLAGGIGTPAAGRRDAGGEKKNVPTHAQIAARAKAIWESKGCPVGKDEENWREAEAQLRAMKDH